MELQQAKVIIAIVEESSMVGAAERLGVTQPAISSALSSFERELGVMIFHRSRKGLRLTERGKILLPTMRTLVNTELEIMSAFRIQSASRGSLRIAGRQGFMEDVFPALFNSLRMKYPNIVIESAMSGSQAETVEALQSGRADIAFAANPNIKSIGAEIFHRDPIRLAVSKEHPLARKKTITKTEIANLSYCLPTKSDRLRKPIERFLHGNIRKPNVIMETNDYTLMRNIIQTGACAGFIYSYMLANPEAQHSLRPLRIKGLEIARDLTILYRRDDLPPHGITAKHHFVKEGKQLLQQVSRVK